MSTSAVNARALPLRVLGQARAASAEGQAMEQERQFRPQVYWYLSFRCNLACTHCSVKSSPFVDTAGDLGTDDCLRVVDQLAELNAGAVDLTGGEVLFRQDALTIIRAAADRGLHVNLESNGLLFDERFTALARELQARGNLEMSVSLDGGTAPTHELLRVFGDGRAHGSFGRTLAGLRFLKREGVRFNVQMVLHRDNYRTIPQLYALGRELRPALDKILFPLLNPVGRGDSLVATKGMRAAEVAYALELIRRESREFSGTTYFKAPPAVVPPQYLNLVYKDRGVRSQVSCQFPLLGILPNGDVTICALSRDNESLHFGNVRTHRLKDIWLQARMDLLRSRYVAAEHLTGVCGDCVWKYSCKGGCRAAAYEAGGSFDAPLPLCAALAEAGEFPEAYKISAQNAALAQKYAALAAAGCCTT